MLRVLLVDDDSDRSTPLKHFLLDAGYEVVGRLSESDDLNGAVAQFQPDVIIIDTESPSRDTLEQICVMSRDDPRPIVMFTHDGETEKIRAATKAGVSAYVVGGLESARLKPIMDAAMVRFEEYQAMRNALVSTTTKLAERKNIERAKGILMKQRGLDEDVAYQALRKMAMERGTKLGEIARQLIQAAELLS
ncbi:putative transcriptional regulatory protein pdtaR [mine drainage metagenome]|uniref:Putative transcriptional regulatory protein pdtaR n=1 Tax=mine drainage metagenome TaxID=410659 RepID=A0A1J5R9G1_9ZZZZ